MIESEVRKTIDFTKKVGEPIEVRATKGNVTYSGLFTDVDTLVQELGKYQDYNIEFVINSVSETALNKYNENRFARLNNITTDDHIITREWVVVSVNNRKNTGVSATDEEKAQTRKTALAIHAYLKSKGFNPPLCCDNGNGWDLLYKVQLVNNEDNTALCKRFLEALDMLFTTNSTKVLTTAYSASHAVKLYGTVARLGAETETRPHRDTKIVSLPDNLEKSRKSYFEKVVREIPQVEKATYENGYNPKIDIEQFIANHHIEVAEKIEFDNGIRYMLKRCLFAASHKAPEASIIVLDNGAIGYKCFHNGCNRGWKEVLERFEPTPRDKRRAEFEKQRTTKPTGTTVAELVGKTESSLEDKKVWLSMTDIEPIDRSNIISIPSGFGDLDRKIIGFNKGEISLWSGKNGSGKSSVLSQICLQACQRDFKCAIFSGELTAQRTQQWLQLQCAGRLNLMKSTKYENTYYATKQVQTEINEWLDNKLWIYNNDFGNKFENVLQHLKDICEEKNLDMIVLDNLMALDILTLNGDKYQQQTTMILALCEFTKKYNIHLHLVCHPRKSVSFLRKDDISGSADLSNAVDNVFIIHRVGNDFKRCASEFYGEKTANDYKDFGNVIEICKNRDRGYMDDLIGVYYESESKRFLNDPTENFNYGWEKAPTQFIEVESEWMPFGDDDMDGDLPY